ncbi:MAG TPA: hypothetical protein VE397_16855, partial [Stellaceae bacterium]|nr:hypothetical protein [Stellaceae bacterium]
MAEHIQTGSRRRDWLLRQALSQADGTFLVRPFGYLPPVVYQVDAPTRDRLVAVQLFYRRLSLPAVIIAAAVIRDFRSWTFWALTLGFLVLGYVAPLVVLRHAKRVPRSRWTGPAIVAPEAYYSRRAYLAFFVGSLAMILLFGETVRWTLNQPGAAVPWGACGVILVLAFCAARFWTLYRR